MAESWREIPAILGYEASDTGRIRNRVSGRILDGWISSRGYRGVTLGGRSFQVHRILAQTWIPNPENLPLVRHLNDIPADNRLDNLAWGTQAQNVQDALRNGVHGEAKKTQCPIGHPYSVDNTMILYYPDKTPRGRRCRTCDTRTRRAKIALARDNKLNPQERAAIDKEIHTHG